MVVEFHNLWYYRATMALADLRDLVLVIYGLLAIGLTIFFIVLIVLVYRKVNSILDSIKQTTSNIRQTSSVISEGLIQPIAKFYGFISGLRKAMEILETLRKGKGAKSG